LEHCIELNINKVIKILQGSVVTQTVLGGLFIYHPAANVLCVLKIMKLSWQLLQ